MILFPYKNLTVVKNSREKDALMSSLAQANRPVVVSFLNAHAMNLANKDADFRALLFSADYLLRDGIGVAVFLRALGLENGLNMNGTDLTPEIITAFSGRTVALCGTSEPWLSKAVEQVKGLGAKVVLSMDGFQETASYIKSIEGEKPDLIVLAMGMPKQESIAASLAKALRYPAVIVNGGAILDFMAGRFPRAPQMWRDMRMEWLYRLIHEPRRLAPRYLIGGVKFVLMMIRCVLNRRTNA